MRTALSTIQVLEPRSLADALRMLHEEGPLVPMAGCTDVLVGLNFGHVHDRRFLNLWGLRGLDGIERVRGGLRLGALCTHASLVRSALVKRHAPSLVDACRQVGGAQIQNRGTLGGNIANGSPAGDTLPVLLVAGATVIARSVAGEREIPFEGFYAGYRKTVLAPDELIVGVDLPDPRGTSWFRKVGTRAANAISKVVMAGVRGDEVRIALGSVGPTVLRVPRAEAALAQGMSAEDAAVVLREEIAPIDDIRSTGDYRRRVAGNLLVQFWTETAPRRRRSSR